MNHLRTADFAAFSEALERLYRPVALDEFPSLLFSVIEALIPDAILSLDEVSIRTGALRHARNFELKNPAEWMAQLAVNLEREHPAVAYVRDGGKKKSCTSVISSPSANSARRRSITKTTRPPASPARSPSFCRSRAASPASRSIVA